MAQTKNGTLAPDKITIGSKQKIWWKCNKGPDHEWKAQVNGRTMKGGRNCPFCAGRKVSVTNSLATRFPEIAKEWHPKNNGGITPKDVTAGSDMSIRWKCSKGSDHEWRTPVYSRTGKRKTGCPVCGTGWDVKSVRHFVSFFDKNLYIL